ncbi:YigZ family protein [Alkalibacillus almallahensis]|uniref:YigZ family protein n=1 Tax=Alkalibacillus almallahensis TaxID=1379154 RepID=UPI00141DFEF6|nr:YigZ family protein [Alkalibacillus almallahensis]NIK12489.1 putative YigZ family protein [Alkalibacillus almallahensis]
MLENYLTVKQQGEHEIIIQKSRFIGHIKGTETEDEAQAFINQIKKEHASATHNCSAYMIGEQNLIQKAQDDGEPSGTAGVPMLEVLKQMDMKDTTVVVTRYFGGIKLGAGGLIRAYSNATSEAIRAVGAVRRSLMQNVMIQADYGMLGKLENELRTHDYLIDTIDYAAAVTFHVLVPISNAEDFKGWMINLTSDQVTIKDGETQYVERDVEV